MYYYKLKSHFYVGERYVKTKEAIRSKKEMQKLMSEIDDFEIVEYSLISAIEYYFAKIFCS